jgi:hypothetical protein
MENNKIYKKKIGKTIYPQWEYSGKLYFKNEHLYYYDFNYHQNLANIQHIISISELENKIKEYKKRLKIKNK